MRAFHAFTQSTTVNDYVLKFDQYMNLMRRDNLVLPYDYYKNSFISGLNDNNQHYVQFINLQICRKQTGGQEEWNSLNQQRSHVQYNPQVSRQIQFKPMKPTTASIIQQARIKFHPQVQ